MKNKQLMAICSLLTVAVLVCIGCELKKKQKIVPKLVAAYEPSSQPNQHRIHLSWNVEEEPDRWFLYRTMNEATPLLVTGPDGSQTKFIDEVTDPGTYTYELLSQDEMNYHFVSESLEIAKDVVISESGTLTSLGNVGRLFLQNNVVLNTDGQSVQIEAEEIRSEGATIETFAAGQTAKQGEAGRGGGEVSIRAKRGFGKLTLIARGENGGDGKQGSNGKKGATGAPKGQLKCAYYHDMAVFAGSKVLINKKFAKEETAPSKADVESLIKWATAPLEIRKIPNIAKLTDEDFNKIKRAQKPIKVGISKIHRGWYRQEPVGPYGHTLFIGDGENGNQGQPGEDGQIGGAGGNTATLKLEVQDATDFEAEYFVIPGKGGRGGRGGSGGEGGSGGPPADRPLDCSDHPKLNPGESGLPGENGVDGKDGDEGRVEPICIKLGDQTMGDC